MMVDETENEKKKKRKYIHMQLNDIYRHIENKMIWHNKSYICWKLEEKQTNKDNDEEEEGEGERELDDDIWIRRCKDELTISMNERKLLKIKENRRMMSEKEFCRRRKKTCDLFFLDCWWFDDTRKSHYILHRWKHSLSLSRAN